MNRVRSRLLITCLSIERTYSHAITMLLANAPAGSKDSGIDFSLCCLDGKPQTEVCATRIALFGHW